MARQPVRPSVRERLRLLVTGATGPYGAHFAQYALRLGHEVFSVEHNRRTNDSASLLGIKNDISWSTGDIRDSRFLTALIADWEIQCVVHFAALPLVKTGLVIAEPI